MNLPFLKIYLTTSGIVVYSREHFYLEERSHFHGYRVKSRESQQVIAEFESASVIGWTFAADKN